jgi:dihydropyrimidinase
MPMLFSEGVVTGRITLDQFVALTSARAARLFGLYPRKGTIAVGSDADIVIFDPQAEQVLGVKTLHMRVDYNPYEGRRVKGTPSTVISNGQVIVENGVFVGRRGAGRFVKRGPSLAPVGL